MMAYRAGSAALVLAFMLLFVAAADSSMPPGIGRLTANGVEVTAWFEQSGVSDGYVVATFSPRDGFHLYSKDLQPGAIGFPTLVVPSDGFTAMGATEASAEPFEVELPLAQARLPVYPDGRVTLRVPVRRTSPRGEILVTYAACSATSCLMPVVDRPIALRTQ
jgi:hypothetical protein